MLESSPEEVSPAMETLPKLIIRNVIQIELLIMVHTRNQSI